jgi:hypothetical protein
MKIYFKQRDHGEVCGKLNLRATTKQEGRCLEALFMCVSRVGTFDIAKLAEQLRQEVEKDPTLTCPW